MTQIIPGVCDFCDDPNPIEVIRVPVFDGGDLAALLSHTHPTKWAACATCYALFKAADKEGLLQRAIDVASSHTNFAPEFIVLLHKEFWRTIDALAEAAGIASALVDFVNQKLRGRDYIFKQSSREDRVLSVQQLTDLTDKEFVQMMGGNLYYGQIVAKLNAWHKKFGISYDTLQRNIPPNPLLQSVVPHWQTALEQKFGIIKFLMKVTNVDMSVDMSVLSDLDQAHIFTSYKTDLQILKLAEIYSFNQETAVAITESAKRLPHDSPLTAVELPGNGQGWFWFAKPLPIKTNEFSENVSALLWGLVGSAEQDNLAIRFTAFAITKNENQLWPSTEWHWPLKYTFHDMIAYSRLRHAEMYGPGGKFEKADIFDTEGTLLAIAQLSQFFLMSCVWFKQEIIIKEPAHIERAARRRIQHDNKLKEPPTIRVIALRKSHRDVEVEGTTKDQISESEKNRIYTCRWKVVGHSRLQPCGPSSKDRKLIWISEYEAGPPDKPLREKNRVYAVVR